MDHLPNNRDRPKRDPAFRLCPLHRATDPRSFQDAGRLRYRHSGRESAPPISSRGDNTTRLLKASLPMPDMAGRGMLVFPLPLPCPMPGADQTQNSESAVGPPRVQSGNAGCGREPPATARVHMCGWNISIARGKPAGFRPSAEGRNDTTTCHSRHVHPSVIPARFWPESRDALE